MSPAKQPGFAWSTACLIRSEAGGRRGGRDGDVGWDDSSVSPFAGHSGQPVSVELGQFVRLAGVLLHAVYLFGEVFVEVHEHLGALTFPDEFPRTFAHGPALVVLPVEGAFGGLGAILERRQQIHAIAEIAGGKGRSRKFGEGGQEIHRHRGCVVLQSAGDHAGPARDAGHAVSAFEHAAFLALQGAVRPESGGGVRTVVGAKDHERLLLQPMLMQSGEDGPDGLIEGLDHFLISDGRGPFLGG